jgi:hypothetical protein
MTPHRLFPVLVAALLLVCWGCFDSQVAGNTTETENNATARSIRVDSVLPLWNRPAHVATVATLRLDASNFDFSRSDSIGRDLDVQTVDSAPIPFQVVFWDKIAGLGRIRVRIDTSLAHYDSRFLLRWGRTLASRSDSSAVWSAIPDSQRLAINSTLVDDFEGGVLQNLLPDFAAWSTSKSDSASILSFGLVSAPAGRSGQVLHISFSANIVAGQYVGTTTQLAPTPRIFRSMDSLVFWAKGNGTLSPALEHVTASGSKKAWRKKAMDTGWQRIRLRPQDFDSATGLSGNVGWMRVRDSITNLTFLIGGGSDLWIDDIRLYGIDREDLR